MNQKHLARWLAAALIAALAAASAEAATIYQKTDASDTIELSNLDAGDASQEVVLTDKAAARSPSVAASLVLTPANFSDSADAGSVLAGAEGGGFAARPTHTEILAAMQGEGAPKASALPVQQRYQEMMLQQARFNGGANGNLSSTRKYLKVDRTTYTDALSN